MIRWIRDILLLIVTAFIFTGCGTGKDHGSFFGGGDLSGYPHDDVFRINQIQCRGTHNSFHITGELGGLPFLQYSHETLDVQLDMGIRQFELDIRYNQGNGFKVYHLPWIDSQTNCEYLTDCLARITSWSEAHPGHHVIFVFIEPKEELGVDTIIGHSEEADEAILSVLPRERIFTPDDLLGGTDYDSLLEAVLTGGWPTLGEVRNRVMFFLLDSGPFRDEYLAGNPRLEGRIMFTRGGFNDPFGGFKNMDDPVNDLEEIQDAVRNGYLIRTRADSSCIEAYTNDVTRQEYALTSGAQIISTDFPAPPDFSDYSFGDIPGGNPSRCNPLVAPAYCSAQDVEDLSRLPSRTSAP